MEVDKVVELTLEGITPQTALDVGTGSGLFADAFSAHIPFIVAMDVNEHMLKRARELTPAVHYVQGEMEWLPYRWQGFDLIFLGHVLHETHELDHVLNELNRCATQRVAALEWPYRDEPMGPPLHHRLPPDQVIQSATRAGFDRVEAIPLSHMILYRFTRLSA